MAGRARASRAQSGVADRGCRAAVRPRRVFPIRRHPSMTLYAHMTTPRFHEASIHIDAPASRVWQVLTDSAYTKRYMFGCEIASDWSIGGPFDWKGAADGVIY